MFLQNFSTTSTHPFDRLCGIVYNLLVHEQSNHLRKSVSLNGLRDQIEYSLALNVGTGCILGALPQAHQTSFGGKYGIFENQN